MYWTAQCWISMLYAKQIAPYDFFFSLSFFTLDIYSLKKRISISNFKCPLSSEIHMPKRDVGENTFDSLESTISFFFYMKSMLHIFAFDVYVSSFFFLVCFFFVFCSLFSRELNFSLLAIWHERTQQSNFIGYSIKMEDREKEGCKHP